MDYVCGAGLPRGGIVEPQTLTEMSISLIKIARDGKVVRECTLAELGLALRAKTILPTDHYWRPGMKDWERVSVIATEAGDEFVRSEEQIVKQPPIEQPTPNVAEAQPSAMSRLHLSLGAITTVYAFFFYFYAEALGQQLSKRLQPFSGEAGRSRAYLNVAERVLDETSELFGMFFLIIIAYIFSRVVYFIVRGKRCEADRKPLRIGEALFTLAFLVGAFVYIKTMMMPGIFGAIVSAGRSPH